MKKNNLQNYNFVQQNNNFVEQFCIDLLSPDLKFKLMTKLMTKNLLITLKNYI